MDCLLSPTPTEYGFLGMQIRILQPAKILQPYIESYAQVDINWSETPSLHRNWRLIPFGKPSMILLHGDPHLYHLANADQKPALTPRAFLVGQLKVPVWLKFGGHTKMIKVQFRPAGLRQFIHHEMSELTDKACIGADEFWGHSVDALHEQLQEFPQFTPAILNGFFEGKLLPHSPQIDYVNDAIAAFESCMGNMPVTCLESRIHISGRHLERIFQRNVGLTPNQYRKLIRLNQAFKFLEQHPGTSFTNLSHSIGYYDQAHFSHDFKQFAGSAPSKLRSQRHDELFVTNGNCFAGDQLTVN